MGKMMQEMIREFPPGEFLSIMLQALTHRLGAVLFLKFSNLMPDAPYANFTKTQMRRKMRCGSEAQLIALRLVAGGGSQKKIFERFQGATLARS